MTRNLDPPPRPGTDSMAPRLPVVLSQSATVGPHRDSEESLVTDLLMQHGADVSIVRPLAQLARGQTDLLMLEGLSGDFVLLAWQHPADALSALANLGIEGVLGATPFTEAPRASGGRRIYAFDLRHSEDGQAIRQAIAALLRDRQTPTFSLGLAQRQPAAAAPAAGPQESGPQPPEARITPPNPAARPAPSGAEAPQRQSQQASDETLEALVDSLDACDL